MSTLDPFAIKAAFDLLDEALHRKRLITSTGQRRKVPAREFQLNLLKSVRYQLVFEHRSGRGSVILNWSKRTADAAGVFDVPTIEVINE